jgi:nickel/cobalt transporter (NiCoT) family protein
MSGRCRHGSGRLGSSRLRRVRGCLDRGQWRTVGLMSAVVLGLHAVGFFLLVTVVAPHHHGLGGSSAIALGTGLTAYTLGLRHAFDADHIAAIDNTTRKLMAEGKRPMSVGFFFSLGHSSIVFALAFLFAIGVRALGGPVTHGGSALHGIAGWVGTGVSGTFLYVILWGIFGVLREMRAGAYDEHRLEAQLASRGLMNRVLGRFTRLVREPRHMYPVGLLFGLGFDTASEVAFLFLAVGAAGAGLPFAAIICLPILFAAGMSLLDTIDGSFMNFAYEWAFSKPVRKIFYNLTITGLSVAVALVIGTIELSGLLAQKLGAHGAVWTWLENIDMNTLGFIIAGMFAVTWLGALTLWRFGHIEERWASRGAETEIV